jgi:hypothetical protein
MGYSDSNKKIRSSSIPKNLDVSSSRPRSPLTGPGASPNEKTIAHVLNFVNLFPRFFGPSQEFRPPDIVAAALCAGENNALDLGVRGAPPTRSACMESVTPTASLQILASPDIRACAAPKRRRGRTHALVRGLFSRECFQSSRPAAALISMAP